MPIYCHITGDYFYDTPVTMCHWRVIVLTVFHVAKITGMDQHLFLEKHRVSELLTT